MCDSCGCKKAEESNIQRAEAFWESDYVNAEVSDVELEVEIPNNGMARASIGYSLRKVFEKLGYHISPIPKKHKGLTYVKTNSNPVITFIYSKYRDEFEKSLNELGINEINFYEMEQMPIISSNSKLVEAGFEADFESDGCGCGDEMVMEAETYEGETEVFCANCGGGRRGYDSENPTDEEIDWERMSDKARMKVDKSRKGITQRKALRQYLQRSKNAEFELHDWYDPMSDYGMMNTNPVIQEQKDEFYEEMDNQKDSYDRAIQQERAIERRMRNINRAVRNERDDATSPISRGMPIAGADKGSAGGMVPNYIKYGLIALGVYAGYKVASDK